MFRLRQYCGRSQPTNMSAISQRRGKTGGHTAYVTFTSLFRQIGERIETWGSETTKERRRSSLGAMQLRRVPIQGGRGIAKADQKRARQISE